MKKIIYIVSAFLTVWFVSCGNPNLDISEVQYEPKLVIEGYLFADRPVDNIRVFRNFPLNQSIDTLSLFVRDADVQLNGVRLKFNPFKLCYFHDSIIVQKGNSYTLKVSGTVDGKLLQASSSTTVPAGTIMLQKRDFGTLTYGDSIMVGLTPATSSDFYAFSIIPDSASMETFAFENNVVPNIKREEVEKEFNRYIFQLALLLNIQPYSTDIITQQIREFNTWFYSPYTVVVYAGDKNFKDYVLTAKMVKEFDGNFHEPRLNFSGDGIGVFGSAITDTIRFTLRKK